MGCFLFYCFWDFFGFIILLNIKLSGCGFQEGGGMLFNHKIIWVVLCLFVDAKALTFFDRYEQIFPKSEEENEVALQKGDDCLGDLKKIMKGKAAPVLQREWEDDLRRNCPDLLAKSTVVDLARTFYDIVDLAMTFYGWQDGKSKGESPSVDEYKCFLWNNSDPQKSKAVAENFFKLEMCFFGCPEAHFFQRIKLISHILQDVVKKYPDNTRKIVYTSFSAGGLLQDFMAIYGLISLGYINLELNFIDTEYDNDPNSKNFIKNFDYHLDLITGVSEEDIKLDLSDRYKEYKGRRDALRYLIEFLMTGRFFYEKPQGPGSDPQLRTLNLNGSPNYFQNVYKYLDEKSSKKEGNVFVAVDWGPVPFYEIGEMLGTYRDISVDFSQVFFLGFRKDRLGLGEDSVSDFYLSVPQKGPLSFIWKKKANGEFKYLLDILNKCQNDCAEFIGKNNFREKFIKRLHSVYKDDIKQKFKYVFYEASIPFEWSRLIEQTGIPDKNKLVVYQLTRNVITPGVKDDTVDLFPQRSMCGHCQLVEGEAWEKISLDQFSTKLKILKNKLVELRDKLQLINGKIKSLGESLGRAIPR